MKIDGLTHPKTKDLAIRLGVPLPHAVGLLEFLWYFVGKQTPRGDIGKWSNGVIAAESQWAGDADEFVETLVACGFLDECPDHRLIVHDWSEHAPRWVFAKLKKEGKEILSPNLSRDLRGRYKGSEVKGSEVKGSEVKPREAKTNGASAPAESAKGPDAGHERQKPPLTKMAEEVFNHWREVMGHPQAKFSAGDDRSKKVIQQLKAGYSVDDLKLAVDGCAKTPHNMGDNDRGQRYDGLNVICKNGDNVDRFIRTARNPDLTRMSSAARKTLSAAQRWIENG